MGAVYRAVDEKRGRDVAILGLCLVGVALALYLGLR
jgi:hypothetical protein